MCCAHHVGIAYINHYRRCNRICSNLIKGIRNDDNGDLPVTNIDQNKNQVSNSIKLTRKTKKNKKQKKTKNTSSNRKIDQKKN